jgi:hypothetical protein
VSTDWHTCCASPSPMLWMCKASYFFFSGSGVWTQNLKLARQIDALPLESYPQALPTLPPFLLFFLSFSTGVWTQGFRLARQALYHLSHSASPFFVLGIFEIGSCELFPWAGLDLIFASQVARIIGVSYWHQATLVIFQVESGTLQGSQTCTIMPDLLIEMVSC